MVKKNQMGTLLFISLDKREGRVKDKLFITIHRKEEGSKIISRGLHFMQSVNLCSEVFNLLKIDVGCGEV